MYSDKDPVSTFLPQVRRSWATGLLRAGWGAAANGAIKACVFGAACEAAYIGMGEDTARHLSGLQRASRPGGLHMHGGSRFKRAQAKLFHQGRA